MIIKNVKIHTMEPQIGQSGVISNGFVIIDEGKVAQIGEITDTGESIVLSGDKKAKSTGKAELDGGGGWLMPGFIDAHTHLGMLEDGLTFEGDDLNETGDSVTPHLRAIDAINPFDRCFEEAREAGVTCVASGPGSANPIGGQISILKTLGRRIDKMMLRSPAAMKFALGENPKGVYHNKNQSPETRMATAALIRENLYKAKKYAEAIDKARRPLDEDEDERDEPDYDIKSEALSPVVRGELSAHIHAHRADDIFTAIRLSKEFNMKYVVIHCTEGILISEELQEEGVLAVVGPNLCDRSKPELRSLTFENPKKLDEAGVTVALTTDHPVIPIQYLPLCAALAVKNGMKFDSALKAITINPAKILGIDDVVGSIKPGKHADLVLYDGNPFDMMSVVKQVWVNGEAVKR